MCLDAQSGIKAKRQPFRGWCCLEVICRRDVLSCTFCQLLELRIPTPLLDWKRCSQALSRHHSYHPRFEIQISLRATAFSMFRKEICSVVLRELLDVCVEPLNCACRPCATWLVWVVELRLDEICVTLVSFLVHVIRDLALPHDVLQHRLVLVDTCP